MRLRIADLPEGVEVEGAGPVRTLRVGDLSAQVEAQGDELVIYDDRITTRQRQVLKAMGHAVE